MTKHTWTTVALLGMATVFLAASPALAQSIDLNPVTSLLQGIIDTITGPLGIAIATLAVVGIGLS